MYVNQRNWKRWEGRFLLRWEGEKVKRFLLRTKNAKAAKAFHKSPFHWNSFPLDSPQLFIWTWYQMHVELKCECQRMVGKGKKAKDAVVGVSQIRYKILYILHSIPTMLFNILSKRFFVSYLFILRISAGALIFLSRLIRFSNFA